MDNCEVMSGELTRTVATRNVTVAALMALLGNLNTRLFYDGDGDRK